MSDSDRKDGDAVLADEKYTTIVQSDDLGDKGYAIRDKALVRKLDLRLLPALTLLYLLSFLDRSNGTLAQLPRNSLSIC